MRKNKERSKKSNQSKNTAIKLFNKYKKVVIFGVVFAMLFFSVICIVKAYRYVQKQKYDQEQQLTQSAQQLRELSDKVSQLEEENEQLKASPSPTPIQELSIPKTTPTPTVTKTSECNQQKLDAFRKAAIAAGHDEAEINSFIEAAKASGCPSIPKTDRTLNDINSKLDRIQMCQSYGVCY